MSSFYIARQPILDAEGNTFGYEILFRSTENNAFDPSVDGDTATARVLVNTIVEAGLESIVGDAMAFINLTQCFLENPDLLDILEPGRCVLEILEDVVVTDEVFTGVQALHARGHTIALDDYIDPMRFARLLPMVTIIKYDMTQHTMEALQAYQKQDAEAGRLSLVERVETLEEFEILKTFGIKYFQGYYFAKPRMMSGKKLPENKVAILQLMAQINDETTSIDDLAETLSYDVSLSVRTLRYLNSPLSALSHEVTSIRHAAVLLGREPIRNWVILLVMTGINDKPPEITKMALTRARFCQLLAQQQGLSEEAKYFTLGLLSMLGVLMDTSLEEALTQIAISDSIKEQLLERAGPGARMLELAHQLESLDPDLEYGDAGVGPVYQQSIIWAEQTFGLL